MALVILPDTLRSVSYKQCAWTRDSARCAPPPRCTRADQNKEALETRSALSSNMYIHIIIYIHTSTGLPADSPWQWVDFYIAQRQPSLSTDDIFQRANVKEIRDNKREK